MRAFVTGSTGYVGGAVVADLRRHGHEVTGLVRSKEKAAAIERLGARAVVGTMTDQAAVTRAAREHDVLVHAAFDYSAGAGAVAADRAAVEALLAAARGAARPTSVVYTSGIWVLGATGDRPADESAPTNALPLVAWRPGHERLVLDAATDLVATAVIRPGIVWGGGRGLVGMLFFEPAAKTGAATFVGDGANRWPVVHRDDLGSLYRLVVERRARGLFHGVDGTPTRVADAARAASEAAGAGGATRGIPLEQARKQFGPMADALATDQVIVTRRAGEVGWAPARRSFVSGAAEAYREWRAETAGSSSIR